MTRNEEVSLEQLEEIIETNPHGDKHLDAVTERGEILGVQTGRNSKKCTLCVKYYHYPKRPLPWRNLNVFTTMYDACHIMLGCLRGLSGDDEFYCEATITTQKGNRLPGLSNKKEAGFEDGRVHWKSV
jgi:hypothetical protein